MAFFFYEFYPKFMLNTVKNWLKFILFSGLKLQNPKPCVCLSLEIYVQQSGHPVVGNVKHYQNYPKQNCKPKIMEGEKVI